jgi:WD40 repeat protein
LTLLSSCGAVSALAISADERWSALGSASGAVEEWDIDSGVPVSNFVVSDQPIAHVALSPKGASVAATDTDGRLVLWSVTLQRERLRREPKARRSSRTRYSSIGGFQALAFTDDETVVAFDPTGIVLRWGNRLATAQAEQIKLTNFKPEYVADAKIAPRAGILVATGHDTTLRSWSLKTGARQIEINRVSDGLWNNAVAVDAGGAIAITTSHDRLHVWRLEDSSELARQYIGHFHAGAMEVGASTGRLYLGGFTGGGWGGSRARSRIEVYDTSTLRQLKSLVGNVGGVRQLAVGAAERTAVSSGGEASVKVWRLDAVKDRSLRRDHEDHDEADDEGEERDDAQFGAQLNSITFSKDGAFALCGADANAVIFFDVEKATPLRSVRIDDEMWYRGPGIGVLEAGLSPDGRHMVAGSGSGKMRIARVREDILEPAKPEYSPGLSLEGHFDGQFHHLTKVKFLPSGHAVTGDADGNICVWRLQDGERLRKIKVGDGEVIGLTVDGRNETLVSATKHGAVRWWSVDDLSPVAALNTGESLTGLAALPSSDGIIIGCDDGALLCAHPGIAVPQSVKVGAGSVSALAVQTASGLCIWGCLSGDIGVATVIEGRLTTTALRQGGDGCTCISPADDKAAFVAGTAGGELTLWDLGARKAVASFRADSGIAACGMAPRSGIILAGDRNGRVHWLALEGATLASLGAVAV